VCGIVGISDRTGTELTPLLEAMNAAIEHRGPDDSGTWVHDSTARTTGIGMRRLSIIDLAGGHQPMHTADGRYSIVFNGEIYNFGELRDELSAGGVTFRTRCDTEVVLELVARDGERAIDRLNGMFAFCVHDRYDDSLLLARDSFGQKPLFYWAGDGRFAFSSELPSLLVDERIERRLDPEALAQYLRFWSVPAPRTMIRGVRQLLPGQWLRWSGGNITTGTTEWSGDGRGQDLVDDAEAISAVRAGLVSSVQRHMIADVPVGVFLSGGVDSAAMAAAAMAGRSQPIQTFTVKWSDPSFDESADAAKVAAHLGTDHHELAITAGGFDPEVFDQLVAHMGQPLSDNSLLPTYILCREARRHVTVAITGDGGDEVFAGYFDLINAPRVAGLARLPSALLRAGVKVAERAGAAGPLSERHQVRQIRRALGYAAMDVPERLWEMTATMTADELSALLQGRAHDADTSELVALLGPVHHLSPLRQMMRYRTRHVLADQMLVKSDRMSMASSLELRSPLLDRELAAIAGRLQDGHLVRDGVGKWVLREAIRPWVPESVLTGAKRGFGAPLASLRNEAFADLCRDLVLERGGVMEELFDRSALERVVDRVLSGERGSASESEYRINAQLWALLVFAAWCRRFGVTA